MRYKLIAALIILQINTAHAIINEGDTAEANRDRTQILRDETVVAGALTTINAHDTDTRLFIEYLRTTRNSTNFNTKINMLNDRPTILHMGTTGPGVWNEVEVINGVAKNDVVLAGDTRLTTNGEFGA